MNVIFICVIVLDKMCFHMHNLCWFKQKKIFECFRCFWKVFCFYQKKKNKIENFQKQCCPVLATQSWVIQVACYSRELACWFWRLVCEWKVQSRGVHRDFCGSARDSLVGRPSSHEKHLEIFFTILSLSALATCPSDLLATHPSREKRVFCISKTVFKTFSIFPSNFCDYSLSFPFLSQLKLFQTLFKLHFCIISSQSFKKRYGFSLSHFIFHVLSLLFLFLWVYWCHYDFVKCHTRSRVCFILMIVHCLRVSVFDFITDICMLSGVCTLFHDSGCFIHIMFMVFYHIICHLNPCNA